MILIRASSDGKWTGQHDVESGMLLEDMTQKVMYVSRLIVLHTKHIG